MKPVKNILEQLLKKKNFISFDSMDKIFLKIFDSYSNSVVFIRIKDRILFIGVKIPQLIAHFTSLKSYILSQFLLEKNIDIFDIKFFYYNPVKSYSNNSKKKIYSDNKDFLDNSINKNEVYMIIEKKCYKKEYHDILYKMYIKAFLYGKK